jgi:hypothetical protein
MEIFVYQQNYLFFRKQLAARPNLTERLQLLRLLVEEETKNQQPLKRNRSLDTSHDGSENRHEQIR